MYWRLLVDDIIRLKAEIFDIVVSQEELLNRVRSLDKIKAAKLAELNDVINKKSEDQNA